MKLLALLLITINFSLSAKEKNEKKNPVEINSAVDQRLEKEELLKFSSFSLLAHKQNYLLPVTYNFKPNNVPNETLRSKEIDTGLDRVMRIETKFQLSFKFPLLSKVFAEDDGVWAAYTQLSFWQVYNQNSSRPFRESNYEPEIFYIKRTDVILGGLSLNAFVLGIVHQSNGQTDNLSRSWNRVYGTTIFSRNHFALALKAWYRVPDGSRDENPDLQDYIGRFEARLAYSNAGWTYSILARNSLKDDYKGYSELGISFPMDRNLKGFLQYANGYGESLLDYNTNTHRIGLGFIISEII